MKKLIIVATLCVCGVQGFSQSQEVQQLLLNVEKLAQFKKILNNMYTGYKVLYKGYTTIKDISEGNFDLHRNFLDGLLQVSPAVRKYKRIADIVSYQVRIVKEYKAAFNQFKQDKHFTTDEIDYLGKVYGNLFDASLKSLDELAMVVTAGKLRMSDDERLQAIDRIYNEVVDQFSFLQEFNNSTAILAVQREKDMMDIELSRKIYSIKE
ncbi:MAG TPA: TerB family tellurite resistance protein [Chitinophagaceae bacterium]|nr:TerB family tellurite resistance protein [Chitinophagaceae bacterium]